MAPAKKFAMATALLLSAVLLTQQAYAQRIGGYFTYPVDEGLKLFDGVEIIVRYKCDDVGEERANLNLWCRELSSNNVKLVARAPDVVCAKGFHELYIDFDYEGDECWFNMRDKQKAGIIDFNSISFSLSAKARTTFGLEEPTPASTKTGKATTAAEPAEHTETKSSGDDEMGMGAKAGIGVGVALGVVGIASLAGAFWLVRKRRRGHDSRPKSEPDGPSSNPKYTAVFQTGQTSNPDAAFPSELLGTSRSELHGQYSWSAYREVTEAGS